MAQGDRLRQFPRSSKRGKSDRECTLCPGCVESKEHHIGSCQGPPYVAARKRLSERHGIPLTGNNFLDSQVVEIMAYDNRNWGKKYDVATTEKIVQEFLGEIFAARFTGESGGRYGERR